MNKRQQRQQNFDNSDANLIVGNRSDCPIAPEQLADYESFEAYVVDSFTSGLTAVVYHLEIDGNHYTLKLKRPKSKVHNLDGKYSFLNEVQRRHDFQQLKNNPDTASAYQHIVPTIYADYRLGILLSPWLEGELLNQPKEATFAQLFSTSLACEQAGLFEWDLCNGNIIIDENQHLWLFDFGYMYRFNPLTELNSDGPEATVFNFIERFETRYLSGWFITNGQSDYDNLELFEVEKNQALIALEDKLRWLESNAANNEVIIHTRDLLDAHSLAISNAEELSKKFALDMFRSHVLDIEDDLHGKSCTPVTIKRVNVVKDFIKNQYRLLKENNALFNFNEGKSKQELLSIYNAKANEAEKYQIRPG